jgi:hypothetical protein
MFRKRTGGIEWYNLAQDRDQWLVVVNIVMGLREFLDFVSNYQLLKTESAC